MNIDPDDLKRFAEHGGKIEFVLYGDGSSIDVVATASGAGELWRKQCVIKPREHNAMELIPRFIHGFSCYLFSKWTEAQREEFNRKRWEAQNVPMGA